MFQFSMLLILEFQNSFVASIMVSKQDQIDYRLTLNTGRSFITNFPPYIILIYNHVAKRAASGNFHDCDILNFGLDGSRDTKLNYKFA